MNRRHGWDFWHQSSQDTFFTYKPGSSLSQKLLAWDVPHHRWTCEGNENGDGVDLRSRHPRLRPLLGVRGTATHSCETPTTPNDDTVARAEHVSDVTDPMFQVSISPCAQLFALALPLRWSAKRRPMTGCKELAFVSVRAFPARPRRRRGRPVL
jgi:hypothetical protein